MNGEEIIDFERWYFSKMNSYTDLRNVFSGLGTVFILGDALIHHILKTNNLSYEKNNELIKDTLKCEVRKFLVKMHKSGFEEVKIAFFHKHSNFTETDENDNICLIDGLEEHLYDDNLKFLYFDYWKYDPNWEDFIQQENISLIFTSDSKILNSPGTQFEFIYDMCVTYKKQVCTIDHLRFKNYSLMAFLITPHSSYASNGSKENFIDEIEISNEKEIGKFKNYFKPFSYNFKMNLSDFESYLTSNLPLAASEDDINRYQYGNDTWEMKVNIYFDKENNFKQRNSETQKQKYYRYMQFYSESLEESKNLHHKIIMFKDGEAAPKLKQSKKELQIKAEIEAKNLKKKEDIDLEKLSYFKSIYKTIDDFNAVSTIDKTRKFIAELLKHKIKLASENREYTKEFFVFVGQAIRKFNEYLNESEIDGYLKFLKKIDFDSTATHYKNFYLNIYPTKKLSFNSDKDSFCSDVLFQLKNTGEEFERTLNSRPDKRVLFEPDEWQVKLLDAVDKQESAIICVPTGGGKTFICYYAMEKILRTSHTDMVVFVAPQKALANQVAAEVYTRFGYKDYPKGSIKSVYAMLMPDYTINDPYNCQILITVPTMLETALSQDNKKWISSIKYIILDEIQTVNDAELGKSLEKLIHFADCPIIAMSAVLRNLESFFDWFNNIEALKNRKINKIVHYERFCDLQKHLFVPRSLKLSDNLIKLHELFAYSPSYLKQKPLSDEFHLLPCEIYEVLQAIEAICETDRQKELIKCLQPNKFFSSVILNKREVKNYENFIMSKIKSWFGDDEFTKSQMSNFFQKLNGDCEKAFKEVKKSSNQEWAIAHIHELIAKLHKQKLLPALIFCKTYELCNLLAVKLTEELMRIEKEDEQNRRDKFKKEDSTRVKTEKMKKQMRDKKNNANDEQQRYESQFDDSAAYYDDSIDLKYTFFDPKYRLKDSIIDEEILQHRHRNIPKVMFEAWKRGIGVHHANFHNKFRSSVECLFRKRHLQVVFATETLSLGINMPCKSVILTYDSIYFDPIQYRQMIGRAGRRGFDKVGNVVFFGVPETKIKNFILSRIDNIKGNYTLDSTLILQMLLMKIHNENVMKIYASFMKNPIIRLSENNYSEQSQKELILFQLRYLYQKGFFDKQFNLRKKIELIMPLRFSNTVSYYEIEELVSSKFFEELLRIYGDENICDKIVLVLSNFIKVRYIPKSHEKRIKSSRKFNIILPEEPLLQSFLKLRRKQLNEYVELFLENNKSFSVDDVSSLLPISQDLPKNSYIYDFYIEGKIERIENVHSVNQTSLWYAFKAFREVLSCIVNYMSKTYNFKMKQIFEICQQKITEKYLLASN